MKKNDALRQARTMAEANELLELVGALERCNGGAPPAGEKNKNKKERTASGRHKQTPTPKQLLSSSGGGEAPRTIAEEVFVESFFIFESH